VARKLLYPVVNRGAGILGGMEDVMDTVDAHVGELEAEFKIWGVRLDKLLAETNPAGTEAKIDYRKRLDDLKEKYVVAGARVAELKAAGTGKREILKSGVETAWTELQTAFTRLAN
jgi:hypothetical protein